MPSQITPQQYGQAVLEHVQTSAYPESEEVISASLPSSALPEISKLVEQAREDVKANIRKVSRDSAPDIDGWISQAKQLRIDIERCQDIARDIVEQAQQGDQLERVVHDATSKAQLLNGELDFNKSLATTLEQLQSIRQTLDDVQEAVLRNRLLQAVHLLGDAEMGINSTSIPRSARVVGVFGARLIDLRRDVAEKLTDCWHAHICADREKSSFKIRHQIQDSLDVDIDALISGLVELRLFDNVLDQLCKDINLIILLPRFQVKSDRTVESIEISGNELKLSGQLSDLSAEKLFLDVDSVISFVRKNLPVSVVEPLAGLLMPALISKLISIWLTAAVPEDINGMADFEHTISLVQRFAEDLDSYGWPGKCELVEWMNSIPNLWLKKRQEASLNQLRKLLSQEIGSTETVERVEKQVLSQDDDVFASNGGDDWNAGWSDEEASPVKTSHPPNSTKAGDGEDEEDVSAWGLDGDEQENAQKDEVGSGDQEDDSEAWGWGDENEETQPRKYPPPVIPSPKASKGNGKHDIPERSEREITLKETYNISSLPKEVFETILRVVSDAASLETPEFANSLIATATTNLLSLPGLILAMYRASASTTYSRHSSGPMLLYNDSVWLSERLHHFSSHQTTPAGKSIQTITANNMDLGPHIQAIEGFGKHAYAKEMDSQRIILADLLDGAQGFVHCTEHPFNQECDIAIASTIDRLRELHKQWRGVLSHSALMQSLGSLLSTITNKIVVDVEDMSDISEPESQQLATYCSRIATLEELFFPTDQKGRPTAHNNEQQEPVPLTALYAPHWLKFQYLANILESSLIDIKYLWMERELGFEFDTEELVDLVVALFADSPHRRSAVAEIRSRRGVR